jgi:toxin ParE1/3/4
VPHRVVFSPEADAQLIGIYRYIAREASPDVAARFTGAIVDHCEGFGTFPQRGARRDDLRPGLRTIGFRRRVTIAFTVDENIVTIIGVFYGGQDFEAALKPED